MKMHKNPYWLAFLGAIAVIVAWYCITAIYKVYQYSTLAKQVKAERIDWIVKELSDDQYIVSAKYTFAVEGKIYHGETDFKDIIYMNAWAAEQAIPQLSSQIANVWMQPGKHSHSSLQKKFPSKECYYAGAMVILLLYFIGLGFYTARIQKT